MKTHKPDKITIHCTDSKNGRRVPIEEIANWHRDRMIDPVGYHGVIQPDGEWQDGRGFNIVGAHVAGHNTGNIGICLVGGDKFTARQFEVLRSKIADIRMSYGIKPWDVYAHYQFDTAQKQGKTCPNISINKLMYFLATNDYSAIEDLIFRG